MLQIHKASAGSGKTYTLAYNYIKLLLGYKDENGVYRLARDGKRHRSILAITFTNKATEEMKRRIVHQLALLAGKGEGRSDYEERMCTEFGCSPDSLRKSASAALQSLLGDYGNFNISTIDSFFQTVLRTFAREANLTGNYDVDLDDENAIIVGVDSMLSSINRATAEEMSGNRRIRLLEVWLKQFMRKLMRDGKGFLLFNRRTRIIEDLHKFVRSALSETYKIHAREIDAYLDDSNLIHGFMKRLDKVTREYPALLRSYASERDALLEAAGVYGSMTHHLKNRIKKWASGVPDASGKTVASYIDNHYSGYKKNAYPGAGSDSLVSATVNECVRMCRDIECLSLIRDQIYFMGLLGEVQRYINENQNDNNAILLRDTNDILRRIISEEEAPFIYERMGVRLRHFLIDEFQDTSRLQWLNIESLLRESLSTDNDNLIIGDEKQSIYRFRNSDVDLIARDVPREFARQSELHGNIPEENTNWRSSSEVVRFNNTVFRFLSSAKGVDDIYANVVQRVAKKQLRGYVKAVRYDDNEEVLDVMAGEIKRQLASGFSQGDITVLVRTSTEGAAVVADLLRRKSEDREMADIQVMSEDALLIGNSQSVQLIASVMHDLAARLSRERDICADVRRTPEDIYSRFRYFMSRDEDKGCAISEAFGSEEVPDGFLREVAGLTGSGLPSIVERIIHRYISPERLASDNVFICAFQDIILGFSEKPGADLRSFLKWWDTKGARSESLALPADVEAIKVMTVHKSKGLEFPCVHVPFVDWPWSNTRFGELVWFDTCDDSGAPYRIFADNFEPDEIPPFLPLLIRKELTGMPFEAQSRAVIDKQCLDVMNCAYVAFTRAVNELFIGYKCKAKDDGRYGESSVGSLLATAFNTVGYAYCSSEPCISDLLMVLDDKIDDNGTFTAGTPVKYERERTAGATKSMPAYYSYDNEKVWEMSRIEDFDEMAYPRRKGIIYHDIMSDIRTPEDVEVAVRRRVMRGFIPEEESRSYVDVITGALADSRVYAWFNGYRRLLTERTFVAAGDDDIRHYRPDRIVWTADGHIDIVDYKFGEEESSRYLRQVGRYVHYVSGMFPGVDVRGYLWYPLQCTIIEV